MSQRKRKRKGGGNVDNSAAPTGTPAAAASPAVQRYSECSASAQSRRRGQLSRLLCELAGAAPGEGGVNAAECALLLRDTLAKSAGMKGVAEMMDAGSELNALMTNIKAMHEAAGAEQRTKVLALAAGVFTGNELKQRWGLAFGNHQLKEARRIAANCDYGAERRARFVPPSKRPKSDEFVKRLELFLEERAQPATSGHAGERRVVDRPLRALHREFVAAAPAENSISLSTFRALAAVRFRLPERRSGSTDDDGDDSGARLPLPRPLVTNVDGLALLGATNTHYAGAAPPFPLAASLLLDAPGHGAGAGGGVAALDLSALGAGQPILLPPGGAANSVLATQPQPQSQIPAIDGLSADALAMFVGMGAVQPAATSAAYDIPTIQSILNFPYIDTTTGDPQQQQPSSAATTDGLPSKYFYI